MTVRSRRNNEGNFIPGNLRDDLFGGHCRSLRAVTLFLQIAGRPGGAINRLTPQQIYKVCDAGRWTGVAPRESVFYRTVETAFHEFSKGGLARGKFVTTVILLTCRHRVGR